MKTEEGKVKVIVMGGKGTAVNVAELIYDADKRYNSECEFIGFAFDDETFGDSISGFPILCKTHEAYSLYKDQEDVKFIFQMNRQDKMKERAQLIESYNIPNDRWYTFIHPTSYVARSAKLGKGVVVASHCAIHSNVAIGNHCTFSALTTIGHDSVIGNNVFTATHVCIGSYVEIGRYTFFGQNSTVSTKVKIAEDNLIGLGASVVKDVEGNGLVLIGSPAKVLKTIK